MTAMRARYLPWLVAAPLMGCSALAAHELAYAALGAGDDDVVHAYLRHLPYAAVVGSALLVVGLVLRAGAARASETTLPLRAASFAIVPLLAFAVQEHLEVAASGGGGLALTRATFVAGVLLQIPVGLVAYCCACALLGAAERLGQARRVPPQPRTRFTRLLVPALATPPRGQRPRAHSQRGPPS